jgi:lycopene cyclase domain-containing protein
VNFLYLGALLVSIAGMVVLDLRFKLFFAAAPLRAAIVLVVGLAFFLAWDVAGITLGIFFRGNPGLLTGVLLAPELPLEELFFLTLLIFTTMNSYAALSRGLSSGRRSRTRIETGSADA